MLITAFTFVLSIYLPPIIQEVKDLSAGIKKSCRNKIIRNNILSVNIFQMVISILIIVILILGCLQVSGIIGENISYKITQAVIWYSVTTAFSWVVSIWMLAFIDSDNYTKDCLLILPIDHKNQVSYLTLIKRQLDKHLSKNEYYRFNDDLVQVIKFVSKKNGNNFYYVEDYCIKHFFNSKHNEEQYINYILNTYDNPVRFYYYSRDAFTSSDFHVPSDNITRFQNYMFSVKYTGIEEFYTQIVKQHVELTVDNQGILIDYYLWCLDRLCELNHDYSFIFSLDIMRSFKSGDYARDFLQDAMKIVLSRQNTYAACGLYRGYFIFLRNNGVDNYIKLKDEDSNTAWMFRDLIYLTMIYFALEVDKHNAGGDFRLLELPDIIYDITQKCATNHDLLLEWQAFIYCYNKLSPTFKITEDRFEQFLKRKSVVDTDAYELLKQILNDDVSKIMPDFQFTRAIEHDFWNNEKIANTNYRTILSGTLNGDS